MVENIQHDYFIWEEKNLTEPKTKLENNGVNEEVVSTNEIKNDLTQKDWKDITDPKLRKKIRQKVWRKANRDKIKAWHEANKDKINLYNKKYGKEYYKKNKDKLNKNKTKNKKKLSDEEIKILKERRKIQKRAYAIANYYSNKEKKLSYQKNYNKLNNYKRKLWLEDNKDSLKNKHKEYYKLNKNKINSYFRNKIKTDIQFKLRKNLRKRLWSAINNNKKVGSAVKDLGCTIDELKTYLESKFQSGMNWDNWTHDGWHIDHIKPLASFDLTDRNQLLEACHYTNLQPLWAKDNLSKGDKIVTTIQ